MAKSKKYRLQIVLDRKEEAKDEAARYLAEMREKLRQEEAEAARLQTELVDNRARRRQEYDLITTAGLATGFNAQYAQQRLNYIKRLDTIAEQIKESIVKQEKRVARAQSEVDEALQVLIQASRELQVMQKHKEKWLEQIRKAEELHEQNEMNEIGNVLYNASQAEKNLNSN